MGGSANDFENGSVPTDAALNELCDDGALLGLDGTPLSRAVVDAATGGHASADGADTTADSHVTIKRNKTVLLVVFVSFFLFAVAEVLGGIFGNSLALASDAATMIVSDPLTHQCVPHCATSAALPHD
jgi:hypothetical protein